MIEKAFNKIRRENPFLSDLMCFNTCITGRMFSKLAIGKAFKKLVSKDDYQNKDLEDILNHCYSLTDTKKSPELKRNSQ